MKDNTKNICVVTAITGGKDKLLPQTPYEGVEYAAFLDDRSSAIRDNGAAGRDLTWDMRNACDKHESPVMNAKIHKILAHMYVDAPYIVWMDGNFKLKRDPHELVDIMGDKDFAFFKHHSRRCLYKEIDACLKVRRGDPQELMEQRDAYKKMGFPERAGMSECGAFVRKNNPAANAVFEKWWAEISRYSDRDQVSFPVAFQGQEWATIPGKLFDPEGEGNDYFEYDSHII